MVEGSREGGSRFVGDSDSCRNGEGIVVEISVGVDCRGVEVEKEIGHVSDEAKRIVTGDGMPNGC